MRTFKSRIVVKLKKKAEGAALGAGTTGPDINSALSPRRLEGQPKRHPELQDTPPGGGASKVFSSEFLPDGLETTFSPNLSLPRNERSAQCAGGQGRREEKGWEEVGK